VKELSKVFVSSYVYFLQECSHFCKGLQQWLSFVLPLEQLGDNGDWTAISETQPSFQQKSQLRMVGQGAVVLGVLVIGLKDLGLI
jgi:hypothetical protein